MHILTLVLASVIASTPVHAGWLKRLCGFSLIEQSPNDFEIYTEAELNLHIDLLRTQARQRLLKKPEQTELLNLLAERRKRVQLDAIVKDPSSHDPAMFTTPPDVLPETGPRRFFNFAFGRR